MPPVSCSLAFSNLTNSDIELALKQQKQQKQQQLNDKKKIADSKNPANKFIEIADDNNTLPNLPTFNVASWCSNNNNKFQNQIAQNQFQLQTNPLGPNAYGNPYYGANYLTDPYYSSPQPLFRPNQHQPNNYPNPYNHPPQYPLGYYQQTFQPYQRENFSNNGSSEFFRQLLDSPLMPMNKIDEMLHIILIILLFLFIIQLIELILR